MPPSPLEEIRRFLFTAHKHAERSVMPAGYPQIKVVYINDIEHPDRLSKWMVKSDKIEVFYNLEYIKVHQDDMASRIAKGWYDMRNTILKETRDAREQYRALKGIRL